MIHTYLSYSINTTVDKPMLSLRDVTLPDSLTLEHKLVYARQHIMDEAKRLNGVHIFESTVDSSALSYATVQLYYNRNAVETLDKFRNFFDTFLTILGMKNGVALVSFPGLNLSALILPDVPDPTKLNRALGFVYGIVYCNHLRAE